MLDIKSLQQRIADIASRFKAYLDLTRKDKTKVTKGDQRRAKELEKQLRLILEPEERTDLTVDVHSVARFFGISDRAVQMWAHRGCPKLKHGTYDLEAVFKWWNDNINGGSDSEAIVNVKLEYWRWKTENEKMKAQQTSAKLLDQDEVFQFWANRIRGVWSALYVLENRLPAVLVGKSQSQMQEIIKAEVRRINESYCKDGKFCKVKPKESGEKPRKSKK
jgi:phage terminase Nu1 subunit (DNA packaging protein)